MQCLCNFWGTLNCEALLLGEKTVNAGVHFSHVVAVTGINIVRIYVFVGSYRSGEGATTEHALTEKVKCHCTSIDYTYSSLLGVWQGRPTGQLLLLRLPNDSMVHLFVPLIHPLTN